MAYLIALTCLIVCLYCGGKLIEALLNGFWRGLLLFGRLTVACAGLVTMLVLGACALLCAGGLWLAQCAHVAYFGAVYRWKRKWVAGELRRRRLTRRE
jgi:hypothetical protein